MPQERKPALVVWGDDPDRATVLNALAELDIREVLVARDAVSAFAQLTLIRPRIVLIDAALRPTSGLIFVRELRATPIGSRDAPLVLVARQESDDFRAAARHAGADGVLFWPATADAIGWWLHAADAQPRPAIVSPGYVGPDRRDPYAAARVAVERRGASAAAAGAEGDPLRGRLKEATDLIARWADSGEETLIDLAIAVLDDAAQIALQAGDYPVLRALNGTIDRIRRDMGSWNADHQSICATLRSLTQHLAGAAAEQRRAR